MKTILFDKKISNPGALFSIFIILLLAALAINMLYKYEYVDNEHLLPISMGVIVTLYLSIKDEIKIKAKFKNENKSNFVKKIENFGYRSKHADPSIYIRGDTGWFPIKSKSKLITIVQKTDIFIVEGPSEILNKI